MSSPELFKRRFHFHSPLKSNTPVCVTVFFFPYALFPIMVDFLQELSTGNYRMPLEMTSHEIAYLANSCESDLKTPLTSAIVADVPTNGRGTIHPNARAGSTS